MNKPSAIAVNPEAASVDPRFVAPDLVHVDAKGEPHLVGGRCRVCAALSFPRAVVCTTCLSEDIETVDLGSRGKLYSYSIVHQAPKGWAVPYALGYVDLDDKVEDYFKAGVPLYIIADRRETNDGNAFIRLLGYRTTPEGYVRIPDDPKGIWIEELKVWLQADGDLVLCADEHGNPIPDLREQRELETQRADAAEQKLKDLEAELKRLRGDTN